MKSITLTMKKLLYTSILATILFSCKKEKEVVTNETIVFRMSFING